MHSFPKHRTLTNGHLQNPTNRPLTRSGNLEGKWVANLQQDRMALTLDLSLDGLGFHSLSLSVPPQFPLPSDQITAPEVQQQQSAQLWAPPVVVDRADRWEASSESSQSVVSVGSSPSTAPPLSDLPLTPIPELLHTPTGHSGVPSPRASAFLSERRHPQSRIPGPLDSSPILEELAQGERNGNTIRSVRISAPAQSSCARNADHPHTSRPCTASLANGRTSWRCPTVSHGTPSTTPVRRSTTRSRISRPSSRSRGPRHGSHRWVPRADSPTAQSFSCSCSTWAT